MKIVTFDKSKLLSVSKDGLEYLDDQGCRCTIDFDSCRDNFKKRFHPPERIWARDPNYVAVRNVVAKPPHITLTTDPPTRFVFAMPDPDFDEFQFRLFREAGVKTFDMS